MTQFVHLTDAKKIAHIERVGILASRTQLPCGKGFYCTPILRDFYRTHQWLRELRRSGAKSMCAVQFRLSPDAPVWIGRFKSDHIQVTATEAAKIFHEHEDGLGLEVVVPQSVTKSSITRIYAPSQVVGWRFCPEAKGKKPFCGCLYCNRGQINAYRVITEKRLTRAEIRANLADAEEAE